MNITRRILEGIHEVELQVTPEFQKPKKLSVYHVHDLLKGLGWGQIEPDFTVGSDKGVMVQRTWAHPDIPGVRIVALRPTSKTGDVTVADLNVVEVYAWRADWGKQEIVPSLKDVEDTAKFLAASYGLLKIGGAAAEQKFDYTLPSDLQAAVEKIVWMRVRWDTGATIDEKNPLIVMAKAVNFIHQAAPERGKLMGFLTGSDLGYQWSDDEHAYLVWPGGSQSSVEFRKDVRDLFIALRMHP